MEEFDAMGKKTSRQQKRRRAPVVRVPGWYYALLGGIALVGIGLIVYGMQNPTISVAGMTEKGDYPKGAADAPVTMWEWSSFQ